MHRQNLKKILFFFNQTYIFRVGEYIKKNLEIKILALPLQSNYQSKPILTVLRIIIHVFIYFLLT